MKTIGNESLPSIINDPFKKNCITAIRVNYSPKTFEPSVWVARAWVDFSNGNTSGEQKFAAETFDDVVIQVREFIKTLQQ